MVTSANEAKVFASVRLFTRKVFKDETLKDYGLVREESLLFLG